MGVVAIDVWVLIQPGRSFFTRLCCACELWLESFREQRMVIKKNPRFRVASSVQLVPGKEKQKNYWVDHRGPKKFLERKKNEWITGLVECLANWRRQRVRLSIAHAAVATRREMQACVLSRPLSCRFQTVSPVGIVQEKIGFRQLCQSSRFLNIPPARWWCQLAAGRVRNLSRKDFHGIPMRNILDKSCKRDGHLSLNHFVHHLSAGYT
jgi:hypothetical protein